jgi:hypothetical protein
MGTSIQMELFRNAQTANAICALLDEFKGGEFTSREGKALLKKHRSDCVQFDTLNDNNWFEVSRVEYFDLPDCDPIDIAWRFTLDNETVIVSDWRRFVGDSVYSDGCYHTISAVEKLENVQPQGKRYYYKVRKNYAQKMAREFVRKDDIEDAMRKLQKKLNELEADYESLKALKAVHFDNED